MVARAVLCGVTSIECFSAGKNYIVVVTSKMCKSCRKSCRKALERIYDLGLCGILPCKNVFSEWLS